MQEFLQETFMCKRSGLQEGVPMYNKYNQMSCNQGSFRQIFDNKSAVRDKKKGLKLEFEGVQGMQ